MKLEFPRQIFKKILKCQIAWKFVQWEPSCSMRKDRHTDREKDVTELIFCFAIFPALLKIPRSAHTAVFTCFVWIWEQTAIISLYSIDWLVCITETESVYWSVRPGSLYTILRSAPHSVFTCFMWIWEQTAIISLYSINWLVCITETECVYCAVRTEVCNAICIRKF